MSTAQQFSRWLAGTPTGTVDYAALRQIVDQYPYFWPAGLLQMFTGDEDRDHDTAARLRQLYAVAPTRVMAEIAFGVFAETMDTDVRRMTTSASGNDSFWQPEVREDEVPLPDESLPSQSEGNITHTLEHDPLEDAIAHTFGVEEGGAVHNTAIPSLEAAQPITEQTNNASTQADGTEPVPQPLFTSDYFSHQGLPVNAEMPVADSLPTETQVVPEDDPDRGLMVVRSFADWMQHFQQTSRKEQEEAESKKAVRAMWQKEKLAAALQEEDDEIPEEVFQMAVASIAPDGVVSESLAEILAGQGKWERAVEMYRKLSAQEPAKSAYFARKIEALEARHSA